MGKGGHFPARAPGAHGSFLTSLPCSLRLVFPWKVVTPLALPL
jgi:hypothetical protein